MTMKCYECGRELDVHTARILTLNRPDVGMEFELGLHAIYCVKCLQTILASHCGQLHVGLGINIVEED